MIIQWQSLLAQNNIPEHQWPASVEEVEAKPSENSTSATMMVITYPSTTPVTVQNPATGQAEWNPQARAALALIYKAYKTSLGKVTPPVWSRSTNAVSFRAA